MAIITKDNLKEISLPFPSFKPNTLILSEQVNDNNDELQYRANLLIKSFLKHVDENIQLEGLHDALKEAFDTYVVENNARVLELESEVDNDRTTINNRVDSEVSKLNKTIATGDTILDNRITREVLTLDTKVSNKADLLELKNTLLYLKSGDKTLSVADLSGLGGGTGRKATYLASGHPITKSNWLLDETDGLYYVTLNHGLNTSLPMVTYYDSETNLNVFDITELVDSNSVKVYTDTPIDTYIAVIDGTGSIDIVQAIIDDEQTTDLRTWSSKKIKEYVDSSTPTPIASNVTMADGSTVEDTVTANKASILENTNLANQAINKANEAFQRGDNVKQLLVDKLISEGLDVSTNDTFEDLIDGIVFGRKWASGTFDDIIDTYLTTATNFTINPNLNFVPSLVLITFNEIYCDYALNAKYKGNIVSPINIGSTNGIRIPTNDQLHVYFSEVNNTNIIFTLKCSSAYKFWLKSINWYAFE